MIQKIPKKFNDGEYLFNLPPEVSSFFKRENFVSKTGKSVEFVGVIEVEGDTYFFLPKAMSTEGPLTDISTMINVLNRYDGKTEELDLPDCITERGAGKRRLNLGYGILNDWLKYGEIRDQVEIRQQNGKGRIDWKRTIDNYLPVEGGTGPVYVDFDTKEIRNSLNSRLIDIQRKIVSECDKSWFWLISNEYIASELHGYKIIKEEKEDDILFLEKALRGIYCERTIHLIRIMIQFLDVGRSDLVSDDFSYGCSSFHNIWENVCKTVLGGDDSLKKLIPQPRYKYNPGIVRKLPLSFIGQIPDILIKKDSVIKIYDAKYYDLRKKSPPGWKDMVKQFFYGWSTVFDEKYVVENYFIFPGDEFLHLGKVNLERNKKEIEELGEISCIEVPSLLFYECYLRLEGRSLLKSKIDMVSVV